MAKRFTFALCAMLATTGCGSAPDHPQGKDAQAALRLEPGMWEQSGGPGAQASAALGVENRRCISAAEAQSTANGSDAEIKAALAAQAKKDSCTLGTVSINGPTIAYQLTCSGAQLQVKTQYNGTSSTFETTGGGMPKFSTASRRVGDC